MAYDRVKNLPTKVAAAQNLYETISYKQTLPYRCGGESNLSTPKAHELSDKELRALEAALDVMIYYFRGEQDYQDPVPEKPEHGDPKIVLRVKRNPPDAPAK